MEIPNSVTTIDDWAFKDCRGLSAVLISTAVTLIVEWAFYGCSGLTAVEIPSSVTSIGERAFSGCSSLESITVQGGNTSYDSRKNCNALIETATNTLLCGCKNTTIPNTVTSIGVSAFYNCSGLTATDIPKSVTTIAHSAFSGCSILSSLDIPTSVTSIGERAFSGCIDLMTVTSLSVQPPELSEQYDTFYGVPSECVLYVPSNSKDSYKKANGWKRFTDIRELPAGVEGVVADATNVRGENGVIRIEGAEGAMVEVYNAAGVCVFSGVASEIPVAQRGIYVVKVAGRATKIAL